MKVKIRDIPSEGLELIQSVPPSSLGLSEEDIPVSSLLTVKAHLERFEDTVTVRTEVRGRYSFICARCLDVVENTRLDVFDFDYPVKEERESLDLGEDIRHLGSREDTLAGNHFIQHGPERPDVGPLVDDFAARLLGRHVGCGAEDDTHAGRRRRTRERR